MTNTIYASFSIEELTAYIEARPARSCWDKGVKAYALELLEDLAERTEYEGRTPASRTELLEWLLNGADSWESYSWGGSALIYNYDIAARLCTPSELKKTREGYRRPNAREEWLDVQARALHQATMRICLVATEIDLKARKEN